MASMAFLQRFKSVVCSLSPSQRERQSVHSAPLELAPHLHLGLGEEWSEQEERALDEHVEVLGNHRQMRGPPEEIEVVADVPQPCHLLAHLVADGVRRFLGDVAGGQEIDR